MFRRVLDAHRNVPGRFRYLVASQAPWIGHPSSCHAVFVSAIPEASRHGPLSGSDTSRGSRQQDLVLSWAYSRARYSVFGIRPNLLDWF